MDITRPARRWPLLARHRRLLWPGLALVAVLLGAGISTLWGQRVERRVRAAHVQLGTVSLGPLREELRAPGSLQLRDPQWLTAPMEGRIERLSVQPGQAVKAGDSLLKLSNPAQEQRVLDARWQHEQAEAECRALQATLGSQITQQRSAVDRAAYAERSALLQWNADEELLREGLVTKIAHQRSQFNLEQARHLLLERTVLTQQQESVRAQIKARQAAVERLRQALAAESARQDSLWIRAPMDAVVQELGLQIGQSVAAGASLARLGKPESLMAELQVPESQARELAPGQRVELDLRNSTSESRVRGHIERIAPKVQQGVVKVNVALDQALPPGARPDLSIDGTVLLRELPQTVQVPRPLFSQPHAQGHVYRLDAQGLAWRVPVRFGAAAVGRIAIEAGLQTGDRIVTSDTSDWPVNTPVRLE